MRPKRVSINSTHQKPVDVLFLRVPGQILVTRYPEIHVLPWFSSGWVLREHELGLGRSVTLPDLEMGR